MSGRNTLIALGLVVVAAVLQSTILADSRLQAFGSAPSLVVLVVIASVRYMEPEPAVLLGFTGGLLMDLLGGQPIGMWALVLTVVAYITLRLRDAADDGPIVIAAGVLGITLLAGALWVVLGTILGLKPLADPSAIRRIILPAMYNVVVAAAVLPGVTWLMRPRSPIRRGWAT